MREKKYHRVLKENQYIYLVRIDQVTMNFVAKRLGFKVFDARRKYYKEIDLSDTSDNEPFRDIQVQQMIVYLLEQEFDLQQYTEIGLVKQHFPCHHFEARQNISDLWKRYFTKTLLEPLSPVAVEDALLPLKQIAFYHGVQNGFYFAYLVTFTSFMLPLSLAGIAAFIYNLLDQERRLNVTLLPFTCIFTSLWMSVFFETWRRRQRILAHAFESETTKEVPVASRTYSGRYEVDSIDLAVTQTNRFPTLYRRLIWEGPIFLIFGAGAVILTILIERIKTNADDDLALLRITQNHHRLLTTLISILQAVAMLTLNFLYETVCRITVEWENHK